MLQGGCRNVFPYLRTGRRHAGGGQVHDGSSGRGGGGLQLARHRRNAFHREVYSRRESRGQGSAAGVVVVHGPGVERLRGRAFRFQQNGRHLLLLLLLVLVGVLFLRVAAPKHGVARLLLVRRPRVVGPVKSGRAVRRVRGPNRASHVPARGVVHVLTGGRRRRRGRRRQRLVGQRVAHGLRRLHLHAGHGGRVGVVTEVRVEGSTGTDAWRTRRRLQLRHHRGAAARGGGRLRLGHQTTRRRLRGLGLLVVMRAVARGVARLHVHRRRLRGTAREAELWLTAGRHD